MKKHFFKIISFILIISSLLLLASCENEYKNELGLHFKIPSDMKKINIANTDICYVNGDVTFFATRRTRELLANPPDPVPDFTTSEIIDPDPWLPDPESTVPEYTEGFINANRYYVDYEYDEESNKSRFWVDVDDNGNYVSVFFVITGNKEALYTIGMECKTSEKETYAPIFEQWAVDLYIKN